VWLWLRYVELRSRRELYLPWVALGSKRREFSCEPGRIGGGEGIKVGSGLSNRTRRTGRTLWTWWARGGPAAGRESVHRHAHLPSGETVPERLSLSLSLSLSRTHRRTRRLSMRSALESWIDWNRPRSRYRHRHRHIPNYTHTILVLFVSFVSTRGRVLALGSPPRLAELLVTLRPPALQHRHVPFWHLVSAKRIPLLGPERGDDVLCAEVVEEMMDRRGEMREV
jgi:hypothetical protein